MRSLLLKLGMLLCLPAIPLAAAHAAGQSEQRPGQEQTGFVNLQIDHATIAGSDLSKMRAALASLGLKSEYGGKHSNGMTHMALVGFDDGSYLELVSTVKPGETNIPIWKPFILEDGGPCGWAARAADVAAEAQRASALDVTVQGPFPGGRRRPDGIEALWKLAFLGDQPIGAVLPFLIEDVTPRENRVKPTPGVMGTELTGIAGVVIGVKQLDKPISTFRRLYHWPAPRVQDDAQFGARLAHFQGTPVILAAPRETSGWLSKRIAHFGEAPVAFLIRVSDFQAASKRCKVHAPVSWLGQRVAWFDTEVLQGTRLGIVDH